MAASLHLAVCAIWPCETGVIPVMAFLSSLCPLTTLSVCLTPCIGYVLYQCMDALWNI